MARRAACLALLSAVVLTGVMAAREEGSRPADVSVRVIVTDARGRNVTGLLAADIEISDASQQQKIQTFANASRGPRRIGILLDEYHVSPGPAVPWARV